MVGIGCAVFEHCNAAGMATPLVLSVHTIVSFDFAVSQVPGWHTTIFPPYFVAGAIYAGFAMVLILCIPLRVWYNMKDFITDTHLVYMGKVMLATGLKHMTREKVRLHAVRARERRAHPHHQCILFLSDVEIACVGIDRERHNPRRRSCRTGGSRKRPCRTAQVARHRQ